MSSSLAISGVRSLKLHLFCPLAEASNVCLVFILAFVVAFSGFLFVDLASGLVSIVFICAFLLMQSWKVSSF